MSASGVQSARMAQMLTWLADAAADEARMWLALALLVLIGLAIYVLLVVIRLSRSGPDNRWSRILRKSTYYHPELDPWRESARRTEVEEDADEEDEENPPPDEDEDEGPQR